MRDSHPFSRAARKPPWGKLRAMLRSNGTGRACLSGGRPLAGFIGEPVRGPVRGTAAGRLLDMVYSAAAMISRVRDGSETGVRSVPDSRRAAMRRGHAS